jgi:dihydrofolate reductase
MRVSLVAAVAENRVIGRNSRLPWRLPDDLRRFKEITMGKPVIMGRKTFQSIGRPLPGRTNIVVSRDPGFAVPGVWMASGLAEALGLAERMGADEAMVIGGGEIYALALPLVGRLYLTEVRATVAGDAFFPVLDSSQWRETAREERPAAGPEAPAHAFVVLERVR